jgi:hypothetical protein
MECGGNYVDEQRRHQLVHRLTRRLEGLGYRVNLELGAATAYAIIFKVDEKTIHTYSQDRRHVSSTGILLRC